MWIVGVAVVYSDPVERITLLPKSCICSLQRQAEIAVCLGDTREIGEQFSTMVAAAVRKIGNRLAALA